MNRHFTQFALLIALAFSASHLFAQQPALLLDVNPGKGGSFPYDMVKVKQQGYCFFAFDGTNYDLCGTDGTPEKTRVIKKFINSPGEGGLKKIGAGKALFVAADSTHGNEVWVTDGTSEGTLMLHDFDPGINGSAAEIGPQINGKVFLKMKRYTTDQNNSNWQLWVTDGTTSGTILLRDSVDYSWYPRVTLSTSAVLNDALIFYVWNHITGAAEIWRSNGTVSGTYRLADFGTSNSIYFPKMITYNSIVLFGGTDLQHGDELWKTDGTPAGTGLLKDLLPGSSGSRSSSFTSFKNDIYFLAATGNLGAAQLWKTDGTTDGTKLVSLGSLTTIYSINGVSGDYLYLNSGVVWRTDGTDAGTIDIIKNYPNLRGAYQFLNVNGTAYFSVGNEQYNPKYSLLKSDGTVSGTTDVFDGVLNSDGSTIFDLTKVDNNLYFVANNGADKNGGQGLHSYDPVTNKRTDYNFFDGQNDNAEILFADDANIFLSLNGADVGSEPYVLQTSNVAGKNYASSLNPVFNVITYPNPSAGKLTVQFFNQNENIDRASLIIRDMTGNIVLDLAKELTAGVNNFELQLPKNLPNGLYVISFITGNETQQRTIALQR